MIRKFIKRNKKKIFIFTLLIVFISTIVFAKTTVINTAPVVTLGANVLSNKPVNISVLTDYTGQKSADTTSKLNQFKSNMFEKGIDVNFNVLDGNSYKISDYGQDNSNKIIYTDVRLAAGTSDPNDFITQEGVEIYVGDDGYIYYDNGSGNYRESTWNHTWYTQPSTSLNKFQGLSNVVSIYDTNNGMNSYGMIDSYIALKSDGTAWEFTLDTWYAGTAFNPTPYSQIQGITDAKWIKEFNVKGETDWGARFGYNFNAIYFLKKDNSLWGINYNIDGILGIGNNYMAQYPPYGADVKAPATKIIDNVQKIFMLGKFNYVKKTDGTVWAWGFNTYDVNRQNMQVSSQYTVDDPNLGLPSSCNSYTYDDTNFVTTPYEIPELKGATSIEFYKAYNRYVSGYNAYASFFNIGIAVKNNGDVYYWGYVNMNDTGNNLTKYSNGTYVTFGMTSTPTPKKITSLSNIKNIVFHVSFTSGLYYLALDKSGNLYGSGHEVNTNLLNGNDSDTPKLIETGVSNIFTTESMNNTLYADTNDTTRFPKLVYDIYPSSGANSYNVTAMSDTFSGGSAYETIYKVKNGDYFEALYGAYDKPNKVYPYTNSVKYYSSFQKINIDYDTTYTGKYHNLVNIYYNDSYNHHFLTFYRYDDEKLYEFAIKGAAATDSTLFCGAFLSPGNDKIAPLKEPVYSDIKIDTTNTKNNFLLLISDGQGNDASQGVGSYYGYGGLNRQLANDLVTNNYTIEIINPVSNLNYMLPGSTKQDITLQELLNASPNDGKFYDSTSTGGLAQLDILLSDLDTRLVNESSRPLVDNTSSNPPINFNILTDYTAANSAAITSKLNQFKSDMYGSGYDVNFNIVDGNYKTNLAQQWDRNYKFVYNQLDNTQLILKPDGTIWGKGDNVYAELGLGDTTARSSFTLIPTINSVKKLINIGGAVLALKKDNTLWVWGDNSQGVLPYGPTIIKVPTQITSLSNNVIDICTQQGYVYPSNFGQYVALKKDGTISSWGADNRSRSNLPITDMTVLSNNNISISGGLGFDTLKSDHKVYSGLSTTPIPNLDNVTRVSTGSYYTIALKNDGTVWGYYSGVSYGSKADCFGGYTGSNQVSMTGYQSIGVNNIVDISASNSGGNSYALTSTGNVIDLRFNKTIISGLNSINAIQAVGGLMAADINGNVFYYGGTTPENLNFNLGYNPYFINIYGVNKDNLQLYNTGYNFFVYISDGTGNDYSNPFGQYYSFGGLTKQFADNLVNNKYNINAITPQANFDYKLPESTIQDYTIRQMVTNTLNGGKLYDSTGTGGLAQLDILLNDVRAKYMEMNDTPKLGYIALDETLSLVKTYKDMEKDTNGKDAEFAERWELAQDPNFFENSLGYTANTIPLTQYLAGKHNWSPFNTVPTNRIKFDTVGHFVLSYSAEDNPNINTPGPDGSIPDAQLFQNYCKTSLDTDLNRINIYVNRRPISSFKYTQSSSSFSMTNTSYDLDHISTSNKGIAYTAVKYKTLESDTWTYGIPTTLDPTLHWEVAQKVKDIDGFTSDWYTQILGVATNQPPVANFKLDTDLMAAGATNNINESTPYNDYDPDGDPIVEKHYWLLTLDDFGNVTSTQDCGSSKPDLSLLDEGNYELEKKVRDDPSARGDTLPSLWSLPHFEAFKVESPLILTATVSPNPAKRGQTVKFDVKTTGYANLLTIYLPDELKPLDTINTMGYFTQAITPLAASEDFVPYVVPLNTPMTIDRDGNRLRPPYTFTVKADNAKGNFKTVPVVLDVQGNIYDGIKTEMK